MEGPPLRASGLTTSGFMLHVLAKEPAVLVNGQAMVWAVLEDGDQLQFGDGAYRFERAAKPEGR